MLRKCRTVTAHETALCTHMHTYAYGGSSAGLRSSGSSSGVSIYRLLLIRLTEISSLSLFLASRKCDYTQCFGARRSFIAPCHPLRHGHYLRDKLGKHRPSRCLHPKATFVILMLSLLSLRYTALCFYQALAGFKLAYIKSILTCRAEGLRSPGRNRWPPPPRIGFISAFRSITARLC